jgi:hypothetical protein
MQQRGLRSEDIALVLEHGSSVEADVVLLRGKDADEEIGRLRARIQALERLRNTKVVVVGAKVITAYASDQKRMRKLSC